MYNKSAPSAACSQASDAERGSHVAYLAHSLLPTALSFPPLGLGLGLGIGLPSLAGCLGGGAEKVTQSVPPGRTTRCNSAKSASGASE